MSSESEILNVVFDVIRKQQQQQRDAKSHSNDKVVDFMGPDELKLTFSKRTGTTFELGSAISDYSEDEEAKSSQPLDMIKKVCSAVRDLSVDTNHPLFFNQLYGAQDPFGLVGELLASTLNTSAYTFEVAPVFTLMEMQAFQACYKTIGWDNESKKNGDDFLPAGLMVPGGSVGNLYGMNVARFNVLGSSGIESGNAAASGQLVAFCSAEAHYSFLKSSSLIGIGRNNLIKVACDPTTGAMLPDALDQAIVDAKSAGQVPFMVGATAGTTVVGAFDPLDKLAAVCKRHDNLWLHVDGAWGFPVVWSADEKVRMLMRGMEKADSITWNPHKLLGCPLQTTVFLTKHGQKLQDCNSSKAAYLFHPDQENAAMDLGDLSLFCGRKADSTKLWFMWKVLGNKGFGDRVDHSIMLLNYAVESIQKNERFILASAPNALNVCFYVLPKGMVTVCRHVKNKGETLPSVLPHELSSSLDGVSRAVKSRLQKTGKVLIAVQPIPGQAADGFRLVIAGDRENMSTEHIDQLLEHAVEALDSAPL